MTTDSGPKSTLLKSYIFFLNSKEIHFIAKWALSYPRGNIDNIEDATYAALGTKIANI